MSPCGFEAPGIPRTFLKNGMRQQAGEMAQQIGILAAKLDNLSLILEPTVEREN